MAEKHVWVVKHGIANEGGDIVEIIADHAKAKDKFDATIREVECDTGAKAEFYEPAPNGNQSATIRNDWVDLTRYTVN